MAASWWTPERIETLRSLWFAGKSASEIAREMGAASRSAVCGKVHRMKWEARLQDERVFHALMVRPTRPRAPVVAKPKGRGSTNNLQVANAIRRAMAEQGPEPIPPLREVPPTARPWTSRGFGECAFPVAGVGADTFSCCGPTDGHTYCPGHRAVMFTSRTEAQKAGDKKRSETLSRKRAMSGAWV